MRPSQTSDENPPVWWSVSPDLRNVRLRSEIGEARAPQGLPGEVVAPQGDSSWCPAGSLHRPGTCLVSTSRFQAPYFILTAVWALDAEDGRALSTRVAWSPSARLGVWSGAPEHVRTLDHRQVLISRLCWQGRKSSRSRRALREMIRLASGPNH